MFPVGRARIVGFHLIDLADDEHYVAVNYWNWRPTLELIRSFRIIDDKRLELMSTQCVGAEVTQQEATAIAHQLESGVLHSLPESGRVLLDSSVTSDPDDGTFYRDDEVEKNYSASKEWLLKFSQFCRSSDGFSVM